MPKKLYLIGAGPGSRDLVSARTLDALRSVDRILGTARVANLHEKCETFDLSALITELRKPFSGTIAVLVGGDCCFFSIASRIAREFSDLYEIERINNSGSIPYFAARIGISYDDACLVSLHGREERIVSRVAYCRKVFALTGGTSKAHDICAELYESGLSDVDVIVGERLSYPDEKIVRGTPSMLENVVFDELSVLYIENENAVDPFASLTDTDFIRSESPSKPVPMTKEEIRRLALSKLALSPKDIMYDIGSGTGSVAIDAARKLFEGVVYAVESRDDACRLIEQNRIRHGAFNVCIRYGNAPECLADLPCPDKAFIGGSSGKTETVLKILVEKNPRIRVVATAVSLQGLGRILDAFQNIGFTDTETICVNISKSKRIGQHDIMTAQNPVYIISGVRRERCES